MSASATLVIDVRLPDVWFAVLRSRDGGYSAYASIAPDSPLNRDSFSRHKDKAMDALCDAVQYHTVWTGTIDQGVNLPEGRLHYAIWDGEWSFEDAIECAIQMARVVLRAEECARAKQREKQPV